MRRGAEGGGLPRADAVEADGGLLYVPPLEPARAGERDAWLSALARRGVPTVVQLLAGDPAPTGAAAPEAVAVDPLEALLARRLDVLDAAPRGAIVLWPLVPGLTDDEELWEEGCRRLAAAGVACVQASVPELQPGDRRELAADAGDGEAYSRLFHSRAAGERRFAATATRHGLEAFFRRSARRVDRRARNESLAELLALGAELWLRLGRGEAQGQELFRASRFVEDTAVDVRALAREGNLEIVEELRPPAAMIVGEWAATGASSAVEAMLAEYLETAPAPEGGGAPSGDG